MKHKLVLGTVQFGCQYGINSVGRPDEKAVGRILEFAAQNGLTTLDTSAAYGNAEEVLGKVIPQIKGDFRIVSKYPESDRVVEMVLEQTLQTLGVAEIYGYLLHHFSVYQNQPVVWEDFCRLKEEGKVKKIGFSLYSPAELEILLTREVPFDLLQFPYNLFDRQFEPYFPLLKDRGVEIHVRSTFLQGLFFKDRETLPVKLKPLVKYLRQLDDYAMRTGMTVPEIALNYNLQNPFVDGVLIGVDTVEQLQNNIRSISDKKVELSIEVEEKELLNPVNWK